MNKNFKNENLTPIGLIKGKSFTVSLSIEKYNFDGNFVDLKGVRESDHVFFQF